MTDTKQNNDITFNFLDAPTGAGKTTAIIKKINTERSTIKNKRFIVVTPYLKEIERVCTETSCIEPKRKPKTRDLQQLILEGKNICCSHALFSLQKKDTFDIIATSSYDYNLIVDEEIEVIKVIGLDNELEANTEYTDSVKQYSSEDIRLLEKVGLLYIDPLSHQILWSDTTTYSQGVFKDLKEALEAFDIYIQGNSLIQVIKKENFRAFQEITFCSYRMEYGLLKAYCTFNNIPINWQHIDSFNIVTGYKDAKPAKLDKLHTYCPAKKGFECTGSVSWYKQQKGTNTEEAFKILINSFRYFKENIVPKDCPKGYFWTTYKAYVPLLTKDRNINKKYHEACNLKATNDLIDRCIIGYFIKRYIHTDIYKFVLNKGVKLDRENYALSEAIQFIWRSNIRTLDDNKVYVFFASKDLKTLFDNWKGDIV